MTWLADFADDFDGPAWATLIISIAAVAVSIIAIIRTRTPHPHWELMSVEECENETDAPMSADEWWGDDIYPGDRYWMVTIRQNGPGSAESVFTQLRLPDGSWMPERRLPGLEVGRGAEVAVLLSIAPKVPGEYKIRVKYRRLPDTRKVRTWESTARLN